MKTPNCTGGVDGLVVFDPHGMLERVPGSGRVSPVDPYEDTQPVWYPVDEASAIRSGDFLWRDGDDLESVARPASELALHFGRPYTWRQLEHRFATLFLGIAQEDSPVGESEPIQVGTAGLWWCPSDAGRAAVGSLVGLGISADGAVLRDQRVRLVAAESRAIGKVWWRNPKALPRVQVRIFSRAMGPPNLTEED